MRPPAAALVLVAAVLAETVGPDVALVDEVAEEVGFCGVVLVVEVNGLLVVVAGVIVARLSPVDGVAFVAGERVEAGVMEDVRLAALREDDFLLSESVDTDPDGLCPELASVPPVALPVGRRAVVEPGGGRVGGLLRLEVVVGVLVVVDEAVGLANEDVVVGLFAAVRPLLGGTISFLAGGDFSVSDCCVSFTGSCSPVVVSGSSEPAATSFESSTTLSTTGLSTVSAILFSVDCC
jgi:hypothetical protein